MFSITVHIAVIRRSDDINHIESEGWYSQPGQYIKNDTAKNTLCRFVFIR